MPAVGYSADGTLVYYFPPRPTPPPPPPSPQTGTNAPDFQHALSVAQQATTAYASGDGSKTTAETDWDTVGAIVANQYRIAETSQDPEKAVAALDRQYASYFQNNGRASTVDAEIHLSNAENEPASSTTQSVDIVTASINVELQSKYGNGNNGVYTAGQLQAAAAAVVRQFGSANVPFVEYVAANMEGSAATTSSAATSSYPSEIQDIWAMKRAAAAAAAQATAAREQQLQQQTQQDQTAASKAVHTYAQTLKSSAVLTAADVSAMTAAGRASFALMMDHYMVQQGTYYAPGTEGYRAEEAALLQDPRTLGSLENQFTQSESGSGLSTTDLQGLAHGGEVAAGEQLLPASQQTGQAIKAYDSAISKGGQASTSAATALQQVGFTEEVMVYERDHGLGLAAPGSAQWNKDAQSFLGSSQRISVRDTVIATYANQLSAKGLDVPGFYAQLWAGEAVEQAQLEQQQGQTAKAVATIATAFNDPNDASSAASFDDSLDPILARQALAANTYVTGLPSQIAGMMRSRSPSDAIQFLSQVVSGASADPQLVTAIVAASAPTLHTDLNALPSAGEDQASQAFVSTAKIYYVLQQAAGSGASGASQLTGQLATWSFDAANATDSKIGAGRGGTSPSQLDNLLADVLTKAYQQQAAPNLFYQWTKLAQGLLSRPALYDNTTSWGNFQLTLAGNAPHVVAFSSVAEPFQDALPGGTKLTARTATAIGGPAANAPVPTVQALTQAIEDKINAGETLPEAIKATRAQMAAEYRTGTGTASEQALAEAALSVAGQNNLPAYYQNPTAANDPIGLASSQLAKLKLFDPAILAAATKTMTAKAKPNLPALKKDAGRAGTAYKQWQADLSAHKPAAVTSKDEQAYLDALAAELDDASGETGQAWLNDPTQVDRLWKAQYLVETTNLAPQIRSGDQTALQTAGDQLQTSFNTLSILADVSAAGGPDKQAQQLTADLTGLSATDPLYQEVMQSGSVQALRAQAQADILAPAAPPTVCLANGQTPTPASQLADEAKVLAEYQGTVLYGGNDGLLATTINASATQRLFGEVAQGALADGTSPGKKLDDIANVLNGLQASPDLAAALYQSKIAGSVSSLIAQYSSQDDPQDYYTSLGQIYADIGGGQSAQGTALRHALELRLGGADPVETHPQVNTTTGRAAALDPQTASPPSYELGSVKSSGASTQLYQDIIDDAPNTSWAQEIASETGYTASGAAPKPINAPNTDPVGLAGVNGLTPETTTDDLINQLGSDEGLTPAHQPQTVAEQTALSRGDFAEYDLNQTVYGTTALGDVLNSVLSSAGVTDVNAQTPVVLAGLPLQFQPQDGGPAQTLSLLQIDGRGGQSAYVGPANVTARSSFNDWIQYNGFPKGTLFVQPNLITNGQLVPLQQDNAYWISNKTGITTWDKVRTDVELGLTVTAGLLATFVQPESAPLWLALAADAADVYMTASATYGTIQAVQSLTTDDGYEHWQNWLSLSANVFGGLAGAGSIATRSATIVGRLGVASDEFAGAANLVRVSEDASDGADLTAGAKGGSRRLVPYDQTLPAAVLESRGLAATVRGISTAEKTAAYKAVGFIALGTNLGSLGYQGYQLAQPGATSQDELQFATSLGLMGVGLFAGRGGENAAPQDKTPGEASSPAPQDGDGTGSAGTTTAEARENWIRAYEIWQQTGRSDSDANWHQAEGELDAQIREGAYYIGQANLGQSDDENWSQAEREILGTSASAKPTGEIQPAGEAQVPPTPARRAIAFWGAHPDDETNTTAAIQKAIQLGYDVDLVYLTEAKGGTLYVFDPVRRIPVPLVDASGKEIRDAATASVTRGEEPKVFAATLGGGSNVRVFYLDNPDYNSFDRPADRSVHYPQVANWNVPETVAHLVGMLQTGGYEAVFTMTGDPAVHPAHQAATEITQAAVEAFEAAGGTAPHVLMAREVGWYMHDDLQPLPDRERYHRIDFNDAQFAAKRAAAEAGYVSQPPGHHNFWPYLRPYEILTSTSPDAIRWLRDFVARQPEGQTAASGSPVIEPTVVPSDYVSPKGALVEAGAIEPVKVTPPGVPPGTEPDVLASLSDPATASLSNPEWQAEFPETAADESRTNYLLNAPAPYVKPPEALSIRDRFRLIRSSEGGFWTGFKRNAVIFLPSSRTPLEALGPQKSGLTLGRDDTLLWAGSTGARSAAAQQINAAGEGTLHYVYRVTAPPDVLIRAIQNGQIGPELIEGAVALVNDKALPSFKSFLNPDDRYAPPSGEPYSAPRAVGMSGRNVLSGVVKGVGTLVTAGAGVFASVHWGLAGGHLLRTGTLLSELGLSMFGLRAFVNAVIRTMQIRLGNRIEQLNKASTNLAGEQSTLDERRSDGSGAAVVRSTAKDVAIANQNAGRAVDIVQRQTSGWRGTLRGIPKPDRDHYQLMALIQKQNPADFAISGGRAFDQLSGASGRVLVPEGAVGRLWNAIRIASHGFNDAAGPLRMATTVWNGISTIALSVATANFIPVHLFNNGGTLFRRFLSLGSTARVADDNHVVQDYSVQPAGATLRGVYRANIDRPVARWITGLGDPDGVIHAGKLGDGTPMRTPSFVERLQWTVFAGTTLGSVPFTLSDGATLIANVASGNWPGAVVSAGRVIADVIWARGAQQAGVDAAREIRGMGPNVRRSKWFKWLNQTGVVAVEYNSDITQQDVTNPRLVDEGWLKTLPPQIVYGFGMVLRVALGFL